MKESQMKPENVAVGMEFSAVDISSYWVVVEGIDGEYALCQYFTCFSGGKDKVKLSQLVNEQIFRRFK